MYNIGNLTKIRNLFDVIKFGGKLLRIKTKTREEKKASTAFKKTFSFLLLIIFIWVGVFTIVTISFYPNKGFEGIKRYGIVTGTSIKYVKGTEKYVPISSFNLDSSKLKEGESILLFFDSDNDSLIKAVPNKVYKSITNQRFIIIIGTAIIGMVGIYSGLTISRNKFGKDFYEYMNNNSY